MTDNAYYQDDRKPSAIAAACEAFRPDLRIGYYPTLERSNVAGPNRPS